MTAKWYADDQLQALLRGPEGDLVERKRGFNKAESTGVLQTVCAFANDYPERGKPGVIFIGVDDKSGDPISDSIDENLLNQLAALGEDPKFSAPLSVNPTRMQYGDGQVAALQVAPFSSPPVKFLQRVYIRSGASTRKANYDQEIRLSEMRLNRNRPYDISPFHRAGLKDLDVSFFREKYLPAKVDSETLRANRREITAQLAVEKMIVQDEGEHSVPTVLGLLILGYRPKDFLPGAYVQFLRINSDEWDDPVDEEMIDGPILEISRRLKEKLRGHNRVRVEYVKIPEEKRHWLYPETALLQIVHNAIMHRRYEGTNAPVRVYWFNNRIEIDNPGGLHGTVRANMAQFPNAGCDYRNPNLAEAMKTLNLVQKFGSGLELAQQDLEKNGNPPMEWSGLETHVTCILRPSQRYAPFRVSSKTIASLAQFLHLLGVSGYKLLGKHDISRNHIERLIGRFADQVAADTTGKNGIENDIVGYFAKQVADHLADDGIEALLKKSESEQLRGLLSEIGRTKMTLQRQALDWASEKERRNPANEDEALSTDQLEEIRETAKAVFAERWEDLKFCLREDGFRFHKEGEDDGDGLIVV